MPKHKTTKYLEFFAFPTVSKKTKYVEVISQTSGIALGAIKWYGPWRQYTYQPSHETVYSSGCLEEIAEYIRVLMYERQKHA